MGHLVGRNGREAAEGLSQLQAATTALRRWALSPEADAEQAYSHYVCHVHGVMAAIRRCELAGCGTAGIAAASADARLVHRLSPLCERLQDWPRGYPGDFQTVEWLCDAVNRAPVGSPGYAIEAYALRSAAAQQHRNKVEEQAAVVARAIERVDGPVRVLSIGCGGSRDLVALRRLAATPASLHRLQVVLNDGDADAVALSTARLTEMGIAARPLVMNVLTAMRQLMREGAAFDLVLAGGLFDYLDARAATFVVQACRRLLAPGASLFFTNIATGNPYRPWMDHVAAWSLIHRSENDIRALVVPDPSRPCTLTLRRDVSRLALLATITRAA